MGGNLIFVASGIVFKTFVGFGSVAGRVVFQIGIARIKEHRYILDGLIGFSCGLRLIQTERELFDFHPV